MNERIPLNDDRLQIARLTATKNGLNQTCEDTWHVRHLGFV
jgi:hypothetical protein